MKKRNAQTTIFIIIAIILITVIIGIIYLNQTKNQKDLEKIFSRLKINKQASAVESSIIECSNEISKQALETIGVQGGYYNKPSKSFDLGWTFIPYYYYEGEYLMPKTEIIEKELSDFIEANLETCIKTIETESFEIKHKDSITETEITKNQVTFKINPVFTLTKDDRSSEFKMGEHPVIIESKLSDFLEVAYYITESHKQDPENICLTCLSDFALEKELEIEALDFADETNVLFVISTNKTSDPNMFEFLNKYLKLNFEEENIEIPKQT